LRRHTRFNEIQGTVNAPLNAHTDAAVKAGATKEEIVDALGVAIMVNAGAAMVYSARTIDAYDAKTADKGA
jgi:alkylhydroperoxidase/carboxymuconolactone decarboxylase family protein YurZ